MIVHKIPNSPYNIIKIVQFSRLEVNRLSPTKRRIGFHGSLLRFEQEQKVS